MRVTADEAGASLRDVERTGAQTRLGTGYHRASGYLIIWGIVWLIGYAATGLLPAPRWGLAWLPLVALGTIGSVALSRRDGGRRPATGTGDATRSFGMALAIAVFIVATDVLMGAGRIDAILAFPALVAALVYVLFGLQRAPRLAWIGVGIFAVALGGWLAGPAVLPFALALGGGGGLILGGLWLRRP